MLLLAVAAGCGEQPDRFWSARWGSTTGIATLESERFVIVFESLSLPVASDLKLLKVDDWSEFEMKVAGETRHRQRVSRSKRGLLVDFRQGMTTIRIQNFLEFEMRIRDGGARAEVDGKSFSLLGRKRTIVVHEDGSATVT